MINELIPPHQAPIRIGLYEPVRNFYQSAHCHQRVSCEELG